MSNEAAERLLAVIMERRRLQANEQTAVRNSMRAYERDVRRATVERIRLRKCNQRFGDVGKTKECLRRAGHSGGHYWATDGTAFGATDDRELAWLDAILDEEAAR